MQIIDYLSSKGYKFRRQGNNWFTNSPFNAGDHTPSFCVFADGGFKDFSTGKAGNIITLAKYFGDRIVPIHVPPIARKEKKKWPGFVPTRFTEITKAERQQVTDYATSRGIHRGYVCGQFFIKTDTGFDAHLGILFPHRDENMDITGAKFRALYPIDGQRFSSSGQLGFYVLENIKEREEPTLYIVEGEANANSLWEHLRNIGKSGVVLSTGGVSSIPKQIPHKYRHLKCKIFIDYDGDEAKYNDRISRYVHLGTPVKLILPKGQDLNSLGEDVKLIDSVL